MCEYCGCLDVVAIAELTLEHDVVVNLSGEVRRWPSPPSPLRPTRPADWDLVDDIRCRVGTGVPPQLAALGHGEQHG